MSNIQNEEILQDLREDFDFFLSQEKWSDCEAIIQSVGDMGQEHEALVLHQTLNRAKAGEARAIDEMTKDSTDEEFIEAYHQDVDPRDEADRNYP